MTQVGRLVARRQHAAVGALVPPGTGFGTGSSVRIVPSRRMTIRLVETRHIQLVRDHDDRDAPGRLISGHAHDLDAGLAVEAAGRPRRRAGARVWFTSAAGDGQRAVAGRRKAGWDDGSARLPRPTSSTRTCSAFLLFGGGNAGGAGCVKHRHLDVFQRADVAVLRAGLKP